MSVLDIALFNTKFISGVIDKNNILINNATNKLQIIIIIMFYFLINLRKCGQVLFLAVKMWQSKSALIYQQF